jgi:low affinity Fe/Cu permease
MITKQGNSSGDHADTNAHSRLGEWERRRLSSRVLHRAGAVLEEPAAGLAVAACIVVWTITGAATGFPDWWQSILYSVGSAVTLIMVFIIQHTQARQISSMQRKLDELLRSSSADNQLIAVEEAPDHLLQSLGESNLQDRFHALRDNTGLLDGARNE